MHWRMWASSIIEQNYNIMKQLTTRTKILLIIGVFLAISFIIVFAEYKCLDSRMRAGHSDSTVVLKKQ
jgi:flagellar biosynthesis/type III secretory pathway M-ring protein FliF/YscJ